MIKMQEVSGLYIPQKQKFLLTEQDIYINKLPGALACGGDKRDRTADLLNAIQALS